MFYAALKNFVPHTCIMVGWNWAVTGENLQPSKGCQHNIPRESGDHASISRTWRQTTVLVSDSWVIALRLQVNQPSHPTWGWSWVFPVHCPVSFHNNECRRCMGEISLGTAQTKNKIEYINKICVCYWYPLFSLGLAFYGAVCGNESTSIIENRFNFNGATVAAHELGHR